MFTVTFFGKTRINEWVAQPHEDDYAFVAHVNCADVVIEEKLEPRMKVLVPQLESCFGDAWSSYHLFSIRFPLHNRESLNSMLRTAKQVDSTIQTFVPASTASDLASGLIQWTDEGYDDFQNVARLLVAVGSEDDLQQLKKSMSSNESISMRFSVLCVVAHPDARYAVWNLSDTDTEKAVKDPPPAAVVEPPADEEDRMRLSSVVKRAVTKYVPLLEDEDSDNEGSSSSTVLDEMRKSIADAEALLSKESSTKDQVKEETSRIRKLCKSVRVGIPAK